MDEAEPLLVLYLSPEVRRLLICQEQQAFPEEVSLEFQDQATCSLQLAVQLEGLPSSQQPSDLRLRLYLGFFPQGPGHLMFLILAMQHHLGV